MTVLKSSVSTRSDAFRANAAALEAAMDAVHQAAAVAIAGGGERARERHVARGKILPRERVNRLIELGVAVP